ncbi:GPP34 family phosphoprotein [Actinocatenispora comari]|uniref:Uncharacterized protein n=1 Tax=Actinocatenispora comari TaxID=2807577 RepID=A0A8J4EPS8_9ACTN|nr:GPP34 family phosphoprotein [Actinocatenispora comari]GIL29049.1 hypothetical protein NUM_43030 [Actinocatenispora comari]
MTDYQHQPHQQTSREAMAAERRELDRLAVVFESLRREQRRDLGRWGVAGELLRILTDPFTGRHQARSETLRMVLVAAVLAELMIEGWATCQDDTVSTPVPAGSRRDRTVPGAILIDRRTDLDGGLSVLRLPDQAHVWVAQRVLAFRQPRSARDWIIQLSGEQTEAHHQTTGLWLDHQVEELLTRRLIDAGVARREVYRPLLGAERVRMVAVDGYAGAALNAEVRIPRLLSQHKPLDGPDVVIAGLMQRVGLSGRLRRSTTYRHDLGRYLPQLPAPLQQLIDHAHAAFAYGAATPL